MTRWTAADVARVVSAGQIKVTSRRGRSRKFGNEPTVVDGILFDSKLESKRYGELKLLKMAGQIIDLEIHKNWFLHVHGVRIGYYESDFSYQEKGRTVIEDCKGVATPLYRWKAKHVAAEYGIKIREIKS